jgi:hypothetical protein
VSRADRYLATRTESFMRLRLLLPALLLFGAAGCESLVTEPVTSIPTERQITDAATARASLIGAYDALQSLSYYGRMVEVLGDLPADNAEHSGTFQYLDQIDRNAILADNTSVTNLWSAIYDGIGRVNTIIARVPAVADLSDTEKNEILGEAYALRALHYSNLVKFWGGVPLVLTPIEDPVTASKLTRATVAEVYTQILSDLDQAATLVTNTSQRTQVSKLFVSALRARVLLYKGDYTGALAAANATLAGRDTLVVPNADLFTADGTPTSEDIFRVAFTPVEYNEIGYYYLNAGRREVRPPRVFGTVWEAGDIRKNLTLRVRSSSNSNLQGVKYPTTVGGEDVHVIRLAEVVLIKAEALARLNQLQPAVDELNKVRIRAGLPKRVLGVDVTTQADVINAIINERRFELALEGDRWPDLVRTGLATTVLGITPEQTLFPIPAREINVAPGLDQNPGYD